MKCRKGLVAGVVAVCMMGAMGVNAFAADINGTSAQDTTASTTVKYEVTEGYTWSIHSEIDFGKNAGANSKTVEKTGNTVSVSKNIIPDGKTLKITVKGSGENGEYQIKNGNTILNYTIKTDSTEIATGGNVLSVAAGTNADSKALTFTLTTGKGTAEVAGNYTGTVTYTASIEPKNNTVVSEN